MRIGTTWIIRAIGAGITLAVLCGAGVLGYRYVRADIAAEVYRERLEALSADYAALRDGYNQLAQRTAITELVVENGTLGVRVRSALGVLKEIETPFDPDNEVYVDFVVLDGRVWIRRVFDAKTPPSEAMVIDPGLAWIDWNAPGAAYGKAVYRRLDEGSWVVSVSGAGVLGLAKADDSLTLEHAPAIRDMTPIDEQPEPGTGVGMGEVLRRLVKGE